jgi:hypothetical protein
MLKFLCHQDVKARSPDPEVLEVSSGVKGLFFTTCRAMDENFREVVLNRDQVQHLRNQLDKWLQENPVTPKVELFTGQL